MGIWQFMRVETDARRRPAGSFSEPLFLRCKFSKPANIVGMDARGVVEAAIGGPHIAIHNVGEREIVGVICGGLSKAAGYLKRPLVKALGLTQLNAG